MRSLLIIPTLTIFLFSGLTVRAQQGHIIRGKVRNVSGQNMAQVKVDLEAGNGPLIQQTVTNNEGDFYFANLSETSYAITISAPDYESVMERVDFFRQAGNAPGETRVVELTLIPKNGVPPARPGLNFVQNVPKAARDALELAVKQARDGKSQEALVSLQEAIKIFPDYFDAHFVLAREFVKQVKYSDAIVQLDEARQINPKDDRVYNSFGSILIEQGKYAVAAAVFAEAFRLSPLEPEYPLMRGRALIAHAASIDPSSSKDAAAAQNSALSDAESSITKAYELSGKKLTTALLLLASVYEKKGERGRAADELEQYLRKAPDVKNRDEIREAINKLRSPIDNKASAPRKE